MNKWKNMLNGISQNFKRVTSRYPLTMVLVVLVAISACLFIDQSGALGQFMENKGLPFLILWGIGTYFAETFWRKKNVLKWCGTVAAALIAVGFVYFGTNGSANVQELTSHWVWAYSIVLVSMSVYRNWVNSGLRFAEYCIRVVHELSRLAIVCAIVSLGIALVAATFVTLILNGEHFMLVLRVEFLVVGFLVGSGLLDAQLCPDRELPRFFVVIVKYLLTGMLTAAFVIIYGYILKIVVTRVVPSNEIFRILAGLFIIGLPIWTMIGTFEPDHPLVKIGVKLPYIFIPFLFLQGYAIRERIVAYGMTPLRYLCLALMVFEVVYITVYAMKKRETALMLPLFAVLSVVCLVLPGINMYDVSNRSQKAAFDRLIVSDFHDLPVEDQSRLVGAYYYLAGNASGKELLSGADPAKIEAIKASGLTGIQDFDRIMSVYYDFPVQNADISKFTQMSMVSTIVWRDGAEKPETFDTEKVELFDKAENVVITADVSDFINECISAWSIAPFEVADIPTLIDLPDGGALLVYHCDFSVEPENRISYLNLNAVLLR